MLGKRSWFISSEFRFNVYGKFRGLWTKKKFFGKHETSLCIKSEKRLWIPNDDMIACLKSQKLTEYRCVWPYGTLKQIECSSGRIVQDVWTQHISPTTIRAPTHLLSQVSVQGSYCLFWMMHTTLSITLLYKSPIRANKTPYCQETPQPIGVPSHIVMEIYVLIAITHHFSNIFLYIPELW